MIIPGWGGPARSVGGLRGAMIKHIANQRIALAILLALGGATSALAESQEEQQACMNDAFQFCQAAIPDRNAVFTCLVANRSQISPACRTVMSQYLPADPVPVKRQAAAPPSSQKSADKSADKSSDKSAKSKGPLNITPH
jgi:hypothetical protein